MGLWYFMRARAKLFKALNDINSPNSGSEYKEMRVKLSLVVSNLLGASGIRILRALAEGETDPKQLAQLGDEQLKRTEEQLVDALTGRAQPMHREMLALQLERLQLIDIPRPRSRRRRVCPSRQTSDRRRGHCVGLLRGRRKRCPQRR